MAHFPGCASFCTVVCFHLRHILDSFRDQTTLVLLHQADSKPESLKLIVGSRSRRGKIFLLFDEFYSLNRNLASVPKSISETYKMWI